MGVWPGARPLYSTAHPSAMYYWPSRNRNLVTGIPQEQQERQEQVAGGGDRELPGSGERGSQWRNCSQDGQTARP